MEGESKRSEKNINTKAVNMVHDDSSVPKSIRVRHSPILVDNLNWNFVESELRFVFISGIVFWIVFAISIIL